MAIIVQKFGGTSVADIERIKNVATLVQSEYSKGNKVIVVVSAMAGVTNSLIAKCNQISNLDNIDNLKEYDAAIASGEILTSALLALELQNLGISARSFQGWQIPIKTNNKHGNAKISGLHNDVLFELLDNGFIPIITGFQGLSDDNRITTLGIGGSDTSAALVAASVGAERCDIFTDVNGIYSADPRVVHQAKKLDFINIDELCALCSSGAKVLHPRAALAAKRYGFKLRILSSFKICEGTIIEQEKKNMEDRKITAITSNKNLLKIYIQCDVNKLSVISQQFARNAIEIEQINIIDQSNLYIITKLADRAQCQMLLDGLKSAGKLLNYDLNSDISTVTIVGYGIKNDGELISHVIEILGQNNIMMLASQVCDIKMSLLINDRDTEKLIKLLHEQFC